MLVNDKDIWNKQFTGELSRDLHRENKTEAKKVCLLIDLVPCNWRQNKQLKLNITGKRCDKKLTKIRQIEIRKLIQSLCFTFRFLYLEGLRIISIKILHNCKQGKPCFDLSTKRVIKLYRKELYSPLACFDNPAPKWQQYNFHNLASKNSTNFDIFWAVFVDHLNQAQSTRVCLNLYWRSWENYRKYVDQSAVQSTS